MRSNLNRVLRAAGQTPRSSESRVDDAWAKRRALRQTQHQARAVDAAKTPQELDQFLIVN